MHEVGVTLKQGSVPRCFPLFCLSIRGGQSWQLNTIFFKDLCGTSHRFEVYPQGTTFKDVGGVYMFTKINANGTQNVLYVGETGSFRDRPLGWGHEEWGAATRMGLTHICVLQTSNRVSIQDKLIEGFQPSLNKT